MALKTFVKVSGVNNLSDARYCSGMEVNQLGFSVEPNNPNYTDSEKFNEIKGWLSGVAYVGEIDKDSTVDIATIKTQYDLDAIQVATPAQVAEAASLGLPVILNIDVAMITESLLSSVKDRVDYFLIQSAFAGEISPDILALADQFPLVMAYGFNAETVGNLLGKVKGVSLQGGDEISPGLRDFDEMIDILEALEIDDTV